VTFLKWYERESPSLRDWRKPDQQGHGTDRSTRAVGPGSVLKPSKAMLETCKRGQLSDARDKASLLVSPRIPALRLAEFPGLEQGDIDPITGTIQIRSGKGRKPRNAYLGDKSRQASSKVYEGTNRSTNPALWLSRSGEG